MAISLFPPIFHSVKRALRLYNGSFVSAIESSYLGSDPTCYSAVGDRFVFTVPLPSGQFQWLFIFNASSPSTMPDFIPLQCAYPQGSEFTTCLQLLSDVAAEVAYHASVDPACAAFLANSISQPHTQTTALPGLRPRSRHGFSSLIACLLRAALAANCNTVRTVERIQLELETSSARNPQALTDVSVATALAPPPSRFNSNAPLLRELQPAATPSAPHPPAAVTVAVALEMACDTHTDSAKPSAVVVLRAVDGSDEIAICGSTASWAPLPPLTPSSATALPGAGAKPSGASAAPGQGGVTAPRPLPLSPPPSALLRAAASSGVQIGEAMARGPGGTLRRDVLLDDAVGRAEAAMARAMSDVAWRVGVYGAVREGAAHRVELGSVPSAHARAAALLVNFPIPRTAAAPQAVGRGGGGGVGLDDGFAHTALSLFPVKPAGASSTYIAIATMLPRSGPAALLVSAAFVHRNDDACEPLSCRLAALPRSERSVQARDVVGLLAAKLTAVEGAFGQLCGEHGQ